MANMEVTNNRAHCSFFRSFPPEIRNMVYGYVFSGVSITFINERKCFFCRPNVRSSPPNALAFIRACRGTRWEIGTMWLRSVLFSFESSALMFKTLRHLPKKTISEIRHACVGDYWVEQNPGYHFLPTTLDLLPGLQLDRLTVLGITSSYQSYELFDNLLEGTNGWKELNYTIGPGGLSAWMRKSGIEGDICSYWQRELNNGYGERTTPLVKAYRIGNPQVPVPPSHLKFEKVSDFPALQSLAPHLMNFDMPHIMGYLTTVDVLLVVKRGKNADYRQKFQYSQEVEYLKHFLYWETACYAHRECLAPIARRCGLDHLRYVNNVHSDDLLLS
ncbi:hypothetical protein F4680DRAFT_447652 [Xylaria scruposa]|nr:hypothetical protein F4680DRAFT_447652 [Xylaria scruposa]